MKDTIDGINELAWDHAMNPPARYPSIKSLMRIEDVTRGDAVGIRAIMAGPSRFGGLTRMHRINDVLHTFGVEHTAKGHNRKSPAFTYCNTGDSYAATVLKINGRFRVGSWGDIVERGHYD